ncbi:hypothetical protein RclHR1_05470002 [Rhizophagus clarus]|uniref:Uncharacterized protein n=1 Tax=Rhizophagus clarus TaxID=94130 RepID=A0A2Z6RNZ0_9GLOM|nr:hypothetical protein RclHR1_05470002 [Rhizophagus clarus]GES83849.1 hypothetical protein RCL_e21043_RclHR1_05470002 [Rhizophagus clarus]
MVQILLDRQLIITDCDSYVSKEIQTEQQESYDNKYYMQPSDTYNSDFNEEQIIARIQAESTGLFTRISNFMGSSKPPNPHRY